MSMDGQLKIDKNTFKQIFRDWWGEFITEYPDYEGLDDIIQKMLGCCDPANGFTTYICPSCGAEKKIGFSCKSAFCLSCARAYVDNWVEQIRSALFEGVRYKHAVLTVPEDIRGYFHEKELLDELIKRGIDALNDVIRYCKKADMEMGYVVVLQTAGRAGNWNPHLHIIMTAGGIEKPDRWRDVSYIPFEVLHKKWQYHLFTMLSEKLSGDPSALGLIDKLWQKYPKGIVAYIHKRHIPTIEKLAKYLAKYVLSPPIAISRIISYDGNIVRYWYKDHKTKDIETVELPAIDFIKRMIQHILPKGFKRIRYYGLHATCKVNKVRKLLNNIVGTISGVMDLIKQPKKWTFRERVFKVYGKDPLICDECGCEMILWEMWHPHRGVFLSVERENKESWYKQYGEERSSFSWGRDNLQLHLL